MAKERLKSPRARLFVALDLPERADGGDRGLGAGGARRPGAAAAAAPPRSTSRSPSSATGRRRRSGGIGEIVEAARGAGAADRAARPGPAARSGGRPRLFALPVDSPETVALQAELEERLVAERLYEPEKRPFWPHLTVARVRPEGAGSKRPRPVERPPGRAAAGSLAARPCRPGHALPFRTQAAGCAIHPAGASRAARDGRQ